MWISVAFLGLVVMEAYFWVADRTTIPVGITGSVLYPVLLAALAYVLVFYRTDHYRNFKAFVTACCFGVGVVTLFLLSRRPMLFDAMSNEDGFVETLSAAALFVGAAAFVAVMVGQLRRRRVLVAVMVYYFTTYNYASVEGLRSWARKEYLELIIAVGLMGYAVSTLQQSKALDAARETARA